MKNSSRFFANTDCEYYPCHKAETETNCLFCFCPLYYLEPCPGTPLFLERDGKTVKSCASCTYPHDPAHYDEIMARLKG